MPLSKRDTKLIADRLQMISLEAASTAAGVQTPAEGQRRTNIWLQHIANTLDVPVALQEPTKRAACEALTP
jgi:hypothetical protein